MLANESRSANHGAAPRHVSVLGAGIVGVCTALFLRRAGVPVTLFERYKPGEGCSSGNAGMLGVDSCVPLGLPGTIKKIPAMLSSSGPLGIDMAKAVPALPWFARFALSTRPSRVAEIARALNSLQRELKSAYGELLDLSRARDLVHHRGKIHLFETEAAFEEAQYGLSLQRANGVECSILDPHEVAQLAPTLTRNVARGIYYPNVIHCVHPLTMIERFVEAFVALDGEIVTDEVREVELGLDGPARIRGAAGDYPIDHLVVSAGIGSTRFARQLGANVPMIAHRGYNATLPVSPDTLRVPVKSEDRKVILTPMTDGIRITGIAEIADPDSPPTPGLVDRIVAHARSLLPGVEAEAVRHWMGSRPCTPDSLPVIGRSSKFRTVVFAFGHGHLGLGLGAITGRLVSELLTSGVPSVDLTPFRPDRFRIAAAA
jgi:D-amino-acid dehydrogenase